jgi:DNA-binding FadR family transcriptional regulator
MTSVTHPPIKELRRKELLHQAVHNTIKEYILENGLQPGDSLPSEGELASRLGVSRSSVREAVKSLEVLGILEVRAGSGLFVRGFSFDPLLHNMAFGILSDLRQLTDLLEVRCHLEYGLVEHVLQTVTPAQLYKLDAILAHMRAAAEAGYYSAEDDRAFHATLYENIDNPIAATILDVFWEAFRQARVRSAIPDVLDPRRTCQVHEPIVAAIRSGDVQATRSAIGYHYSGIEQRLYAAGIAKSFRIVPLIGARDRERAP